MIQRDPKLTRMEQKSQGVVTLMVMAMVILLIQIWLVTLALEAFLASHHDLAIPTFLASVFCFLVNLFLLRYLYAIDRVKE
jgi:hypothetical protein